MVIVCGGEDIGPVMQLEAIRYLDACLNRNRRIWIKRPDHPLRRQRAHGRRDSICRPEAEAKGEIGAEDAQAPDRKLRGIGSLKAASSG